MNDAEDDERSLQLITSGVGPLLEFIRHCLLFLLLLVKSLFQKKIIAFLSGQLRQVDFLNIFFFLIQEVKVRGIPRLTLELGIVIKRNIIKNKLPDLRQTVQTSSSAAHNHS